MALSRPLSIAVVAMVLLVGSVTFEVVFHRSYSVEVHDAQGWQTIGQSLSADGGIAAPARSQSHVVLVSANDTVQFRVRVDNGYPWSASEHYDVIVNGLNVAEGTLVASARSIGESTFTIPASTLLSPNSAFTKEPLSGSNVTYANFQVDVGSQQIYANVQLQEAS